MCEMGTTRRAESVSPIASDGISALSPLPSPLRRAIAHLLSQLAIGHSPARGGIKHCDGLPERWSLREPHGARDDALADPIGKVQPDLVGYLNGKAGPG